MRLRAMILLGAFFAALTADAKDELWLGATTTLRDSGFLDAILPHFEAESGVDVRVLALSTGQILRSAQDGNVDLLLVHHPEAEKAFIEAGYGEERLPLMSSRFVLLGLADDPAEIRGQRIGEALAILSRGGYPYISRGDESGTAEREAWLLEKYGIVTSPEWRLITGQGMGASLNIAAAKDAYIFSELASFLHHQNRRNLDILIEGDEELANPYSLVRLNPEIYKSRNLHFANDFIAWLISEAGKDLIRSFQIDGQQVFHPVK